MRGLEREEEDLEDAVSHLSIYLNGLDHLYQEQAQQLKHQIDRAERAECDNPPRENTVLTPKTDPLWSLSSSKVSSCRWLPG
jgi:hypothetical protein